MCYLCTDNDGFYQSCSSCGRLICLDVKAGPDAGLSRAAFSEEGDLLCVNCAREQALLEPDEGVEEFGFESEREQQLVAENTKVRKENGELRKEIQRLRGSS